MDSLLIYLHTESIVDNAYEILGTNGFQFRKLPVISWLK